jgi:hypothetical protein
VLLPSLRPPVRIHDGRHSTACTWTTDLQNKSNPGPVVLFEYQAMLRIYTK